MCVVFGVCCVSIGGTVVEAPSGAGSPPLSITGQKPALVSQSGQTFKSRPDTPSQKIHTSMFIQIHRIFVTEIFVR